MRKLCFVLLALALVAWAANVKLYLTDGTYHLVREYQVQSDRVRYYSVERGEWEEIPLDTGGSEADQGRDEGPRGSTGERGEDGRPRKARPRRR